MKKRFTSLLLIVLSLTLLIGCSNNEVKEPETKEDLTKEINEENILEVEDINISIGSLKGPTTIGLAHMIDEYENKPQKFNLEDTEYNINYDFNVVAMPEEIVTKLNKEEIDMAAIPANLASTLYNKTNGEVKVAAINTLGVLHIIENGNNINTPSDLSNKTIYSIGKGTTPEGVLNSFITKNNIENVNIEYKSEASEIAALMKTEKDVIAMLPEPFVSVLEVKNKNVKRVFDMNEEWTKVNSDNPMVTGVLVIRSSFIEEKPELVDAFLSEYAKSIDIANTDVKKISNTVEKLGIIPEGLSEQSIPNISMKYIDGEDMMNTLGLYLKDLYDFNPDLIGGSMPSEEFYYKK